MKILKRIIIVIAIIIAIPFIMALFVKNDYTIERNITINKPQKDVFNYVKYIKNQDNYSKWNLMDPNAKKEYKGTDGTVGFKSAWDSENKNVGKGEQTITSVTENDKISKVAMDLHFIKPMEGKSTAYMQTEEVAPGQTKVTWVFAGHMPYPINIMTLIVDKELGKELAEGLNNLKGVLEQQ